MAGTFGKLRDIIRLSVRQAVRQYRKYLGVVLSIALGTAGAIVLLTMGEEVTANINNDLELLGGGTVIKLSFHRGVSEQDLLDRPQWFREETITALRGYSQIRSISRVSQGGGSSSLEREIITYAVLGVEFEYWDVTGFRAEYGQLFSAAQVQGKERVCVLTEALALKLFEDMERAAIIGQTVPINQTLFTVVGIIGGDNPKGLERLAFIPISVKQDRFMGLSDVAYLRCADWESVAAVADLIPEIIKAHQPLEGLRIDVNWETLTRIQRVFLWVKLFIYFSVAGTFILGGFGIWSGMMSAVKARTKEIGLKKAMGAEDRDILLQFLTEALCLSVGSALLGVVFGRGALELSASILGSRPPESLFFACVGLSLAFAVALGLGAGYYPSLRASRMDVVTAIRYE